MKRIAVVVACCWLLVPAAAFGADDELPAAVPADLPFPDGADLDIRRTEMAAGTAYVIGFSFSRDADAVYGDFKQYAIDHGYEIGMETVGQTFSSNRGPSAALGVRINDMGSVKMGTVTFHVAEQ